MNIQQKLHILANSAKYDVSCSSSGSRRKNLGGLGNGYAAGICHSWSDDGRCISLLKVLYSNDCIYDCKYCINRYSNDIKRTSFTPKELADLTISFYRRNYIEGLFLSSAVIKNADYTMEQMIKCVKILRKEYRFNGYIHMKAIPGADMRLVNIAGSYADRLSVNIELPSEKGLKMLAPQKASDKLIKPMKYISERINETKTLMKTMRSMPSFVPAGQTTQLIVGATPDSDFKIIRLSEKMYRNLKLKRVYYSAYIPLNSHPDLPALYTAPPLLREHRLYQADWLMRFYGFKANELLDETHYNFDTELDPKADWALRNLDIFPVEVNKADYEMLIRVPGIGPKSASKILRARKFGSLTFEDLKKFKIVLKRAKYFITCSGKYMANINFDAKSIRRHLIAPKSEVIYKQISIDDLNLSFSGE